MPPTFRDSRPAAGADPGTFATKENRALTGPRRSQMRHPGLRLDRPFARARHRLLAASILVASVARCSCYPGGQTLYHYSDRVTSSGQLLVDLDWSPEGNRLVVVEADTSFVVQNLYVVDLGDRSLAPIPAPAGLHQYSFPRWSPTGEVISFQTDVIQPWGLWTIRIDGSDLRFLSHASMAGWSPEGSELATLEVTRLETRATARLAIVNLDGVRLRAADLASSEYVMLDDIRWSPDGAHIAVVLELFSDVVGPGIDVLYLVDAESLSATELMRGSVALVGWADSMRVVVRRILAAGSDQTVFWVVQVNGGCREVTVDEAPMGWPRLSPDGSQIAFLGSDGSAYVMDLAAATRSRLWDDGEDCR